MRRTNQLLPIAIALFFGWLTLLGLVFNLPPVVTNLTLGWAGLLVSFALVLGVLNLFVVHLNRTFRKGNLYSLVLILSMAAVLTIAVLDRMGITENGMTHYFDWVQAPLEAALASLLAFFLLFAGFQLMKRQRTVWSILFLVTAVLVLTADVLLVTSWAPPLLSVWVFRIQDVIQNVIVIAGVRGLLIGVALGSILLSVRMLIGLERPYNK
ncbi:MAG: hypothetical protein HND44_18890 [Chloroflexi bacterium]|nr:hypothetical protein [Ardenticatenaceae bacterium]MBL1130523.1 hypothetical protein [Chloroflexota bacterium]NOG36613.1 hypothetical protein [Chloroflexota bacterium]